MLSYFRFHHIGVAVFDIDSNAKYYIDAGYSKTDTVYDPIQNVYICFLTKNEMPMVELLASKDQNSPVIKTLEKNGVSPYHCCYEVDDINQAITDLRGLCFVPIIRPVGACAIDNRKVCFLFNKNVGLIELVEA
jgi:methylmalonyl-CoA/ethylmalonyl-CoA epimerase